MPAIPNDVLTYWRNAGPLKWYKKNPAFDEALRLRFEPVHHAAARGEYDDWGFTAEGALALLILLPLISLLGKSLRDNREWITRWIRWGAAAVLILLGLRRLLLVL